MYTGFIMDNGLSLCNPCIMMANLDMSEFPSASLNKVFSAIAFQPPLTPV